VFGTAAEVDGMVDRIRRELGDGCTVIATGGLAPIVVPHCDLIDEVDPWLTLEGLRLIFDLNAGQSDG